MKVLLTLKNAVTKELLTNYKLQKLWKRIQRSLNESNRFKSNPLHLCIISYSNYQVALATRHRSDPAVFKSSSHLFTLSTTYGA